MRNLQDMTIFDIRLKYKMSVRAFYALANSLCSNAKDVLALTDKEIMGLRNVGKVTFSEVKDLQAKIAEDALKSGFET
jgi:DNA-directed RNA polymerase alpha subunit